ncbi:MAG TPA: hypothetical protein VF165_06180 [Nocardioidaceae bacterium]
MPDQALARRVGSLAAMVGWVGIVALVSLIVFFIVGGPFGFINDVSNAALAVLAGTLAVTWLRSAERPSPSLRVATALALLGVAAAGVGSTLIIYDITGYFLAGLVSASGFALVGTWLIAANLSAGKPPGVSSSRRQTILGVVAGSVMAVGFVNVPGIVMGIDDQASAPLWLLAAGPCWAGTYLLMPIWSLRLHRSSLAPAPRSDRQRPPKAP